MDIQSRKIDFIQEFLSLQNEELLTRLEKLLHSGKPMEKANFKPMTVDELNARIDKSMDDSKKNYLTSSEGLIEEIDKWG